MRSAPCPPPATRGFTLIELMVVVAMLAILMMLATPSFMSFRRNSQLVATANSFLASINTARAEAMKRGINTYVVPIANQDWTTGWVVFADVDRSQSLTDSDVEIFRQGPFPSGITVDNSGGAGYRGFLAGTERYVSFNGSGYPRAKNGSGFQGNRIVLTNGDTAENRTVFLSPGGRARTCKTGDLDC